MNKSVPEQNLKACIHYFPSIRFIICSVSISVSFKCKISSEHVVYCTNPKTIIIRVQENNPYFKNTNGNTKQRDPTIEFTIPRIVWKLD